MRTNTQHLSRNAQVDIPIETGLAPVFVPLQAVCWRYEELHLHLFELAGAKDEVSWSDFITETFSNLCNAERWLFAAGLKHVCKVHEHSLGRFRTHVHRGACAFHWSGSCLEHQVEGSRFGELAALHSLRAITSLDVVFAEASLANSAVDQRVRKVCQVARGFKYLRWAENGRIDQNCVVSLLHHGAHPCVFDIAQHERSEWAVVI